MTKEKLRMLFLTYGPDFEDVLVFGGVGLACWGVAELVSGAAAAVVGGSALVWLGRRS